MSCDKYLELLSARLDGILTEAEERELEEHLAACPDCRAEQSRLAAIQAAFDELEEIEAPEGFAQGVMERIRTPETEKKVVPLFKRPRFRALAGLAACAALAVGLYGAAQQRQTWNDAEEWNVMVRSFNRDAVTEFADASDAPMYGTCTADQEAPASEEREYSAEREVQKAAPQGDAVSYDGAAAVEPEHYAFQNDQYFRVCYGGTPEPGARIIGSAQSLEDFLSRFSWFDPSEVQAQYDEAYFETGRLLAVVVEEPSGSIRHQISPQGLRRDEVEITRIIPEIGTDDMAAWLILAEVDTMFDDGDELALTVVDSIANDGDELPLTVVSPEDDTNS